MIIASNIAYQYANTQRRFEYPSFNCSPASSLLITGASGAGKTTLLHIIAGLLVGFEGSLTINGIALQQQSARFLDKVRAQYIGIVLQQHHFIASLSVYDNLKMSCYLATKPWDHAYTMHVCQQLGIHDFLYKLPATLSVGEQQRVSIARALVKQPSIVIADEPTSSLDDANAANTATLLHRITTTLHTTLVVVTHDARIKPFFHQHIAL